MITRLDPGARMSEAVVHGDTIYLSGQVGEAGDDVATQTRTALAEIEALLADLAAGFTSLQRSGAASAPATTH